MSDMINGSGAYAELRRELRESEILGTVLSLLSWDQETMMPPAGTPLRAEQSGMLSQLIHERRTSPRLGELIAEAEQDPNVAADPVEAANLREIRREYDRAVRLPTSLVRELAQTTTHAQHVWREARHENDFARFSPWLEKVVTLSRAKAECLTTGEGDLYDALLDIYEPGASAAEIAAVFTDLRARLTPLVQEIASSGRRPHGRIHELDIPVRAQAAFNKKLAARVGFDYEAGRLDTSTHPFCQGVGPGDTRLTTRYRPDGLFDAISSTLHETGHGLYEQGLPKAARLGEPLSDAVSLGIHESQSRMWENFVGRSRPFWQWLLPIARRRFPALQEFSLDEVYGGMNIVAPNLIRVESDEATYNLHIMLRFDLERAMLSGNLSVSDLPTVWNDRVRTDLGIEVPDDRRGCLQDVHWSMGAIGYFPTYTLGNLYAAQFWRTLRGEITDLDERIAHGEFSELLAWLRREIHQHGRRYTAPELCRRVTGEPLSAEPFIRYLEGKLRPLYGI